jgi:hypothetical protein
MARPQDSERYELTDSKSEVVCEPGKLIKVSEGWVN